MSTRLLACLLFVLTLSVGSPTASAEPFTPIPSCSPGPADCSIWRTANVIVTWTYDQVGITNINCNPTTVNFDTTGTPARCEVEYGPSGWFRREITVKRDATPPQVTGGTPSRPPDVNGWYNKPVAVAFGGSDATSGLASCTSPSYSGVDGAAVSVAGTCTDVAGNVSAAVGFAIKYDATAPTASVATSRGPDSNGWFNHAVEVTASGTDATSGIAACSGGSYGGPDTGSATVGGTCRDNAGNTSAAVTLSLKYDATPPAVTAKADRAPSRGWYRKPVVVSFAGADGISGVASCAAPSRYSGPDGAAASVKGACTDAAGNAAEAAYAFKYDGTAPKLAKPKVEAGKKLVRIVWKRPPDFASAKIVRKPGFRGRKSSVIYNGRGGSFADRTVRDGIRYRYELTMIDAAGNASGRAVIASPRGPLYRPAPGQAVRGPLTLAWDAVPGARFYNVQLFRGKVKVLSAWPRKSTLRVRNAWRYVGKTQRLLPGDYRWYVWPAQGTLERPIFGRPLGSNSFVVKGGG